MPFSALFTSNAPCLLVPPHCLDQEEIANDIRSRLWFTYRRGFAPIGDEKGPTTDTGWGCMHRCGQMLVGQALMQLHLGRSQWCLTLIRLPWLIMLPSNRFVHVNRIFFLYPSGWRWNPDRLDRSYLRILKMFEDKPTAPYSIHKIG